MTVGPRQVKFECSCKYSQITAVQKVGQKGSNSLDGLRSMHGVWIKCRNPYITIRFPRTASWNRENAPFYAMFTIQPNHGISEKLIKRVQTRWMARGACLVNESRVEILISRSVFRVQHRGIAKMHLMTQCLRYSQITAVQKSWSKGFQLAGWVEERAWWMNQVSKSLYHDPFFAYSTVELRKCT